MAALDLSKIYLVFDLLQDNPSMAVSWLFHIDQSQEVLIFKDKQILMFPLTEREEQLILEN